MKTLDLIVAIVLLVGGVNWGLVGLFDFNPIARIFGEMSFLTRLVYTIVGIGAVYELALWRNMKTRWHCTGTFGHEVEAH